VWAPDENNKHSTGYIINVGPDWGNDNNLQSFLSSISSHFLSLKYSFFYAPFILTFLSSLLFLVLVPSPYTSPFLCSS